MGDSESFIVDTQSPEVEIYYPNGGEVFDQGETTNVNWSVEDNSMGSNSIALYLSLSQDNFFNLVSDDIPNSGYYAVQFPMENTDYDEKSDFEEWCPFGHDPHTLISIQIGF